MLSKGSQSQIACKILSLGLRKTMSMMFCMSIGAMSVGCLSFGKLSLCCGGLHTWYLGYPLQSEGRSWHITWMDLNGARSVGISSPNWGRGERFWDIVVFLGLSVHWADCFAMDGSWSDQVQCIAVSLRTPQKGEREFAHWPWDPWDLCVFISIHQRSFSTWD